jgi:ubiquinone/menaquinone biosynthesis C-methylase UbiE
VSSLEDLRRIAASVDPIRGWDFSWVRVIREPVPWAYPEVVRRYLKPTDRVLDIATGGGEVFLSLASAFGSGLGTDVSAEMIATARENVPSALQEKVSFEVMAAQDLDFDGETFDVVLNRHGPVFIAPILKVLKPGGYFICQQVGGLNTQNIFQLFGWESSGAYWRQYWDDHGFEHQDVPALVSSFSAAGCRVIASGSFNVGYTFLDVESMLFYLQAVPLPEDFDIERHGERVLRFIQENQTAQGIRTNEHRDLLIVQRER